MKQLYFWISFLSLIYFIAVLIFILVGAYVENVVYVKQYGILLIPLLIDLALVFIIFYNKLVKKE